MYMLEQHAHGTTVVVEIKSTYAVILTWDVFLYLCMAHVGIRGIVVRRLALSPAVWSFLWVLQLSPEDMQFDYFSDSKLPHRCGRESEWLSVSIYQPCDRLASVPCLLSAGIYSNTSTTLTGNGWKYSRQYIGLQVYIYTYIDMNVNSYLYHGSEFKTWSLLFPRISWFQSKCGNQETINC